MGLDLSCPLRFVERSLVRWLSGNPFPDWRTELFFTDDRKGYRMTDNNTHKTDITEFGLLLPNEQVLWNTYSNRSLTTPEDRQMMVQVLRKTAEECGFPEEKFLSNYGWVSRRVKTEITDLGNFALTDSGVIGVEKTADDEDNGQHDDNNQGAPGLAADGHGGDLR